MAHVARRRARKAESKRSQSEFKRRSKLNLGKKAGKAFASAEAQRIANHPAFEGIGFDDFVNRSLSFKKGLRSPLQAAFVDGNFLTGSRRELLRSFKLRQGKRASFKTIIGVRNLQARRGGTAIGRKTLLGSKRV